MSGNTELLSSKTPPMTACSRGWTDCLAKVLDPEAVAAGLPRDFKQQELGVWVLRNILSQAH